MLDFNLDGVGESEEVVRITNAQAKRFGLKAGKKRRTTAKPINVDGCGFRWEGERLICWLPWPPSENHYRRNWNGRWIISADGRAYKKAVASLVYSGGRGNGMGTKRLCVVVECFPPDERRRDLSNLSKALWDALQEAGVFADDEQIDDERWIRHYVTPQGEGGRVVVTLEAIP